MLISSWNVNSVRARIDNITNRTGDAAPVIAGVCTATGTGAFVVPVGPTEYRGGGRQRGIFTLGLAATPGSYVNTIEFLNIQTTGNSEDFGDVSTFRDDCASMSS